MKFEMFDKILSGCKDYHLPICLFMFMVGSGLGWFHHLDASFVAFTATIITGVTGHAFSPAQKDKDSDVPPANPGSNPTP